MKNLIKNFLSEDYLDNKFIKNLNYDRSKGNGPPFIFNMDPNAPDNIKKLFNIQEDPKGANGDGMALVVSWQMFDREKQKEYLVPINIIDSGSPSMTGTGTLTVIIGSYAKRLKTKIFG